MSYRYHTERHIRHGAQKICQLHCICLVINEDRDTGMLVKERRPDLDFKIDKTGQVFDKIGLVPL
jgi:exoribonuclease II